MPALFCNLVKELGRAPLGSRAKKKNLLTEVLSVAFTSVLQVLKSWDCSHFVPIKDYSEVAKALLIVSLFFNLHCTKGWGDKAGQSRVSIYFKSNSGTNFCRIFGLLSILGFSNRLFPNSAKAANGRQSRVSVSSPLTQGQIFAYSFERLKKI